MLVEDLVTLEEEQVTRDSGDTICIMTLEVFHFPTCIYDSAAGKAVGAESWVIQYFHSVEVAGHVDSDGGASDASDDDRSIELVDVGESVLAVSGSDSCTGVVHPCN
jgi:hypothetical protein